MILVLLSSVFEIALPMAGGYLILLIYLKNHATPERDFDLDTKMNEVFGVLFVVSLFSSAFSWIA